MNDDWRSEKNNDLAPATSQLSSIQQLIQKYLWSIHYLPAIILGFEEVSVNKTKIFMLMALYYSKSILPNVIQLKK